MAIPGTGGVYRMSTALKFSDRHNLIFDGNGATLVSTGNGQQESSLFRVMTGNAGITIRNFTLIGNSPTPGVLDEAQQWAYGVEVLGINVEIANVTISAVYGDGVLTDSPASGVWFHDSHVVSAGRNGVAVLGGDNITIERVTLDKSGYCTFDIEPWVSTGVATNVKFLNNTAGTWSNAFMAAGGIAGSVVSGVTVSGNKVTGVSLLTVIDLARRQNVVFTNNTSTAQAAGPVLRFAHIDGLTVTGNIQPLKSGGLASVTDSTGVTYP